MNLYYAMGGGLGHLTRARAFLESYKSDNESLILTSSDFADDKRVVGNFPVIKANKNFEHDRTGFQSYIQNILYKFKINSLFIDSFPFGIIGEFINFNFPENLEINYVARLLKWKSYAPLIEYDLPQINQTFILEPLELKHQEFINHFSKRQTEIQIKYPAPIVSSAVNKIFDFISSKSLFWLIVHAGNQVEISDLISFATEMRDIEEADVNLILISPNKSYFPRPKMFQFDFYPASLLFEKADRIFTACGFNAMEQTKSFRGKHFFIPFERRFDNQFARAARARQMFKAA